MGFTLLEMTVTIGIAAAISGLILANFPQFSRRLELSRTAQAVALAFREAETAALGVREFNGFFPAYGLHFEDDPLTDDRAFTLFADMNDLNGDGTPEGNGFYDLEDLNVDGRPDEFADMFTITGAPRIAGLCAGGGCAAVTSLDVVFVRPNPDVFIRKNGEATLFSNAEIVIKIPTGECRRVVIWATGQLSIEPIEIPFPL